MSKTKRFEIGDRVRVKRTSGAFYGGKWELVAVSPVHVVREVGADWRVAMTLDTNPNELELEYRPMCMLDGEPLGFVGLIQAARAAGYRVTSGLSTTSGAAAHLRESGHTVEEYTP